MSRSNMRFLTALLAIGAMDRTNRAQKDELVDMLKDLLGEPEKPSKHVSPALMEKGNGFVQELCIAPDMEALDRIGQEVMKLHHEHRDDGTDVDHAYCHILMETVNNIAHTRFGFEVVEAFIDAQDAKGK